MVRKEEPERETFGKSRMKSVTTYIVICPRDKCPFNETTRVFDLSVFFVYHGDAGRYFS